MLTKTWIEQIQHAYALKHKYCKVCKQTGDIRVCGNCKESVYCSVGCQTIDYNVHQTICGEVVLDDNLSKLPKDVLNLIVNRLSKTDVDNLTQQSKWINRILKDYFYTKKYWFRIKDIENFDCTQDNTFFKKIENIKIDGDFDPNNINKIYTCFPNIKKLNLGEFKGDLTPLKNLTQLQSLKIYRVKGDLTPLKNLTQLQSLKITWFNGNLTPLSNLTQLQSLILKRFRGNLTPLSNLTQLQSLELWDYNGDNITPLSNLTQLQSLELRDYNGDNIKPLEKLSQLQTLKLRRFKGDLTPLSNLTQLQTLYLPNFRGNYDQFKQKFNLQ